MLVFKPFLDEGALPLQIKCTHLLVIDNSCAQCYNQKWNAVTDQPYFNFLKKVPEVYIMCDYKVTEEDSTIGKDSLTEGTVLIVPPPKDPSVLQQQEEGVLAYSTDMCELSRALSNLYWGRYVEGGLETFLASTQAARQLFMVIPSEAWLRGGADGVKKYLIMANERYAEIFKAYNDEFCLIWRKKQKKKERGG